MLIRPGTSTTANLPGEVKDGLCQSFLESLAPLKSAGKLGYLLLQLPPWEFKNSRKLAHIEECAGRLSDYTLAVEFRNLSWVKEDAGRETLARLREWNLPLVTVDEPQGFHNSVPPLWEASSDEPAVVRFHGHNDEMWNKMGLATSAQRFDYLYSKAELQAFVDPIRELAGRTTQVHAMFNNWHEDKAQRNALSFLELLAAA